MTRNLTLQVNLRLTADADFSTAMEEWFRGCFIALGGELRDDVLKRAPYPDAPLKGGVKYGETGEPWAHFSVSRTARGRSRRATFAFTDDAFRRFLQGFSEIPDNAVFYCTTIDEQGYTDGAPFLRIEMSRHERDPSWAFLTAEFYPTLLSDDQSVNRLTSWLQGFAEEYPLTYGGLDVQHGLFRTAHEDDLGLIPGVTVQESDTRLRGASWFTICSADVVRTLGGEANLSSSGVFSSVQLLRSGSYWLQAKGRFSEFGRAASEQVTRVLRPGMAVHPGVYPDAEGSNSGEPRKLTAGGGSAKRRFVRWHAGGVWFVMDPVSDVTTEGPTPESGVEPTRFIVSLNSGIDIAEGDLEVVDLPDCHDAVQRAWHAFESGDKAGGDAAMNDAALTIREAGWGDPEIGRILSKLLVRQSSAP